MRKVIILAAGCLFLASSLGFAASQSGDLKLPGGKWWQLPKVAKELNLTSEEQKKLDELFVSSRRKMIDLKNNVEKEKFELELCE